jgi:hypothetical protein
MQSRRYPIDNKLILQSNQHKLDASVEIKYPFIPIIPQKVHCYFTIFEGKTCEKIT